MIIGELGQAQLFPRSTEIVQRVRGTLEEGRMFKSLT